MFVSLIFTKVMFLHRIFLLYIKSGFYFLYFNIL